MGADETDVRLHERLIGGDDDALAEIYDRWSALLYSLALRVIRDRGGAQDVTQDVFVYLWEHPEAYNPSRGGLRTWLSMITHRRAVDWVRRSEARNRYQAAAASLSDGQAAEVDEMVVWQAETKAVREAVEALPEPQRHAVILAFYHHRSYREVAQELKIPEGTAKWRLRRGLATLASRLAAEGIIDT